MYRQRKGEALSNILLIQQFILRRGKMLLRVIVLMEDNKMDGYKIIMSFENT